MTLLVLAGLTCLLPVEPIDPWNLLSPKKISTMVFALALIQIFGSTMTQYLGVRTGAILTGFFGGLVSSTATTASLARSSKIKSEIEPTVEIVTYLSATFAMLSEGLTLALTGSTQFHRSVIFVFVGPIVVTLGLVIHHIRKQSPKIETLNSSTFKVLSILKLSIFILVILSVSKICQSYFGQNGLLFLTALVSLFEIHGSIIANIQLHDSGVVTIRDLCSLLTISILASYVSKLFLIWTLGSPMLRSQIFKITLFLIGSLTLTWVFGE